MPHAAAGAVSVLNTAPFRAEAASFLHKADYVVANETEFDLYGEALGLSGRDRAARMRAFVERTGRTIIVTLGGEGVLAASPDEFLTVPALKITPVDTVGAGDTFCGYFGAGLRVRPAAGTGAGSRRRRRLARLPEARRAAGDPAGERGRRRIWPSSARPWTGGYNRPILSTSSSKNPSWSISRM